MLCHITIANFAIVKQLDLELHEGMTTITGETGAGKSIAIDALGLCLGNRAEASMVRPNEDKAELTAIFSLKNNEMARLWLQENDLDDGEECILRRVITKEGRSRAFINGNAVPTAQQKKIGQYLINVHGQHAHQQLLKPEHQQRLLDEYAGHQNLMLATKCAYQLWKDATKALETWQAHRQTYQAQQQLLDYQINELNELGLMEDEYQSIEEEHHRLSNCGDLVQTGQTALSLLYDGDEHNALQLLQSAQKQLHTLAEFDSQIAEWPNMLEEAMIQVQEVGQELQHYLDNLEMDPQRLDHLEQRLTKIHALAKKHYVMPEELYQVHQTLLATQLEWDGSDERLQELKNTVDEAQKTYTEAAMQLSQSRQQHADTLNTQITERMHQLSMEHGQLEIQVTPNTDLLTSQGFDQIQFLVSTNPGQPLQPLGKVASGGELSRISLAIQVITAQRVSTPSLIFDEVDVGISGPTAAVVGKLLRQLASSTQVLCVTHLPQVASCGHQQMFVSKKVENGQTQTAMHPLDENARLQELARLLGGTEITPHTLANAKELMASAHLV